MSGFNSDNYTSRFFEKIRGTTIFCVLPHDSRKLMIVGKSALCTVSEIGQWHAISVRDSRTHEEKALRALAKEHTPKMTSRRKKSTKEGCILDSI